MHNQFSSPDIPATSRHIPLEGTGPQGPHRVRRMKFTDKMLKSLALEPGKKDRMVFDAECPGMAVRLTAAGTRSFVVQWTDPATKRKVREPLGVWGSITIEQARTAARARLGDVARGVDVAAERRRRKADDDAARAEAALSLDQLIGDWGSLHLAHRRPRYAAEAARSLRYAFAAHLLKPAARLTRPLVIDVLDGITKRGKMSTAASTLAYGRALFTWSRKRGKVAENPFTDLPIATINSQRDRALTDDEVTEVWSAAGALPYPFGPFFRLALLSLQRREEVAGMRWSEISADRMLWRVPGDRMKNGKPHDVHLTDAAREVLASIPRIEGQDFVFSTTGKTSISGFSRGKEQLDAAILRARTTAGVGEPMPAWRLHDFRRTGVTHLAAMGFDSISVDKLLAHQPSRLKGVASIYQRHTFGPERARALEAWASHVAGEMGDNVIQIARKA